MFGFQWNKYLSSALKVHNAACQKNANFDDITTQVQINWNGVIRVIGNVIFIDKDGNDVFVGANGIYPSDVGGKAWGFVLMERSDAGLDDRDEIASFNMEDTPREDLDSLFTNICEIPRTAFQYPF